MDIQPYKGEKVVLEQLYPLCWDEKTKTCKFDESVSFAINTTRFKRNHPKADVSGVYYFGKHGSYNIFVVTPSQIYEIYNIERTAEMHLAIKFFIEFLKKPMKGMSFLEYFKLINL